MTPEQAQREVNRRKREREYQRTCKLLPPEHFSDEPAPPETLYQLFPQTRRHPFDPTRVGRRSQAVAARIATSCCGWPVKPTPDEFYDAIRNPRPSDREKALILMWIKEATMPEIMRAWSQQVYTWRQLVAALHRVEYSYSPRIAIINGWTQRPELSGRP